MKPLYKSFRAMIQQGNQYKLLKQFGEFSMNKSISN